VKIYEKLLRNSRWPTPLRARHAEDDGQFAVLTRLKEPENSSCLPRCRSTTARTSRTPTAKSYQEYRDYAGVDEGMNGISTRFAFKILSKVFNFDSTEVAANPVHLMYVLEQQIEREQFPPETEQKYLAFIKEHLAPRYAEFIGKEIQTAYLESYSEYGQNIFDRYVTYADYWIQDQEYRDTDTGEVFDRAALNAELEKIEKPAGIANPKDFRNEIVNFVLRARANNGGKNPAWTSYEKLRTVIEKKMFSNTEDLLPVISFNAKASADEAKKHEDFVTAWSTRATRQAGAPAVRVACGCARAPEGALAMLQSIIDRRLSGKNKSIGNRERFLRRYKDQIREAVEAHAVDGAASATWRRARTSTSRKDISRAGVPPRPGGQREMVHPGNQEYVRGDRSSAQGRRRRRRRRATSDGEGEDDFVFTSARKSSCRSSSRTWPCTWHAPPRRDARIQDPPRRLLQRRHAQQPARGALHARRAGPAHRAGRRGRRELRRWRRSEAMLRQPKPIRRSRDPGARARDRRIARAAGAHPFLDPIDLRYRNRVRVPVPPARR
jgi:hypothetical protein